MKKIFGILLTLCILTTTILTGCGKQTEAEAPKDKLDAEQTISLVAADFSSLDPAAVSDVDSYTTLSHVYEGLMREEYKDGKDTSVLSAASKMDISEDGTVYTFTLRDNKWSDGVAVTAKDFEFGWKRLIDPNVASPYNYYIDCVKGVPEYRAKKGNIEDVGIKAIDDKTFQVTLTKPVKDFPNMLIFNGLAPQRADKVKELGDQYGVGTSFAKMVYNGPFVISEYQQGSQIVYTKNDKYWDAANIKITKATCPIITEPATIFNMFQAKQLDAMGAATKDLVAQLADLSKNGDIYKISGDQCSTFYYIFSFKNKYLANVKVREALSLAINREETLKVLYDRNIPSYGMVTAGLALGDKDFRKTNEEPLKKVIAENKDPKALLMEGLKELGVSDPSQVKLSIYFATASSSSKPLGEYIQKQWNDNLGIKVVLKFAPDTKTYYADRRNGNFDICYGGWGSDYNSVFSMLELFRTGGGNNEGKYSNPKYDELINSSLNETDDSKRMSNFKEAERLLIAEDFAIAPVFYADTLSYAQKYVKGISYPLFCGRYIFRDAYVSGKK